MALLKAKNESPPDINKIISTIALIEGRTKQTIVERINRISGESVSYGAITKRSDFPDKFLDALEGIINALEPHQKEFILKENRLGGPDIQRNELSSDILEWISFHKFSGMRFIEKCTNSVNGDNGSFLLIRRSSEDLIHLSRMIVSYDPTRFAYPTFVTTRYSDEKKVDKVVRGGIVESGASIYAIGRVKNDTGVRFSRLNFYTRTNRTDLYGIRCGHSINTNRPYAHLLYAYQLKKKRSHDEILDILYARDASDPILSREIQDFSKIMDLLDPKNIIEMGLQPLAIDV